MSSLYKNQQQNRKTQIQEIAEQQILKKNLRQTFYQTWQEFTPTNCKISIISFELLNFCKKYFLKSLQTNFFLLTPDLKPSQNITVENVDIPKYKEKLMKLKQYDFYKQRRDNLFDFAMIGEQENIPIF